MQFPIILRNRIQFHKIIKLTIKYFLFGLTFYFFHFTVLAQQSKTVGGQSRTIDSLLSLLKTDKLDTNKLRHLNKLSWEYNNIGSYDSAMFYSYSALRYADVILSSFIHQKNKKELKQVQHDVIISKAFSYNNT